MSPTSVLTPAAPASPPVSRPDRATGLAVTLPRVVTAEWIKLRTVRSTLVTLATATLALVGFGVLGAVIQSGDITPPEGGPPGADLGAGPVAISLIGVQLAQLIFAVVGVLAVTNEFGNGMVRTYFAAIPRRLPMLWAKAIVIGSVTGLLGFLGALVAFLLGQSIMGSGIGLADEGVLRAVGGSGLYLGCISVIGVAVGYLLRHTAGTIAVLFAFLLLIPELLRGLLPEDWAGTVTQFLPSNAGAAFTSVTQNDDGLSPFAGAAVLVVWLLALLVASAWRTKTKDA